MQATVAHQTFSYDKLSDDAKEVAREWYRDQLANDPMDHLHELLDDSLRHDHGLDDCRLSFSLSYCQGDGVAFEGKPDIDEWAKRDDGIKARMAAMTIEAVSTGAEWELCVSIAHEGRYSHWNSMQVHVEINDYYEDNLRNADPWEEIELDRMAAELEEYLNEAVKEISRKLEALGYDEIEYQQSDEVIEGLLSDSTYLFDEDGEFVK